MRRPRTTKPQIQQMRARTLSRLLACDSAVASNLSLGKTTALLAVQGQRRVVASDMDYAIGGGRLEVVFLREFLQPVRTDEPRFFEFQLRFFIDQANVL